MNSELRQDIVSGDWIVIAPQRTKEKKLGQLLKKEKRIKAPIKNCPFENPQKSGNKEPILIHKNGNDWQIQVIENKYPAFNHRNVCAETFSSRYRLACRFFNCCGTRIFCAVYPQKTP